VSINTSNGCLFVLSELKEVDLWTCTQNCFQSESCNSFFYNLSVMQCALFKGVFTTKTQLIASTGTRYYRLSDGKHRADPGLKCPILTENSMELIRIGPLEFLQYSPVFSSIFRWSLPAFIQLLKTPVFFMGFLRCQLG
jgi:hypothetical protein